jgi:uncharacterized repeat protein (TIGR03803 family)
MRVMRIMFCRIFGSVRLFIAGIAVMLVSSCLLCAQTYTVLHNFTGGGDGANPEAGLTISGSSLYGTAAAGGNPACDTYGAIGCGVVFRLQQRNSAWVFAPLFSFDAAGNSGNIPTAPLTFGPDGKFYGTTRYGGVDGQCFMQGTCGTVFSLQPPSSVCSSVSCPWILHTVYEFPGAQSGMGIPSAGPVIFDPTGNLYGTYQDDGRPTCYLDGPCGGVYRLTHSGGNWIPSVIEQFGGQPFIGAHPAGGVIMDSAQNLYGAVTWPGTFYELTNGNGSWTPSILYQLSLNDTPAPMGGLLLDGQGNLYGTTSTAGSAGGGTVIELTRSGNSWAYTTLYSFPGNGQLYVGPQAALTMDSAGNLYGTTYADGAYGYGSVFKLSPSNGSWTYTSLHDFTGGSDGGYPYSTVQFDSSGNMYGSASIGGTSVGNCYQGLGCGVIWEITP